MNSSEKREAMASLLGSEPDIVLAVLIGSRVSGTDHSGSDWDIALLWERRLTFWERLEKTEILRAKLASVLVVDIDKIDLVDLSRARLAIREVVANEGVLLKGDGTLEWSHFLNRTWRELEMLDWEKHHAA